MITNLLVLFGVGTAGKIINRLIDIDNKQVKMSW